MLRILTVSIFFIFCPEIFCQDKKPDFDEFVSKFQTCSFPIYPDSTLLELEGRMMTSYIPGKEFDHYLRTPTDTIWKYGNDFQYRFGGKFELHNNIICLFYGRYYMPDDIDKQVGEIVLCVFNKEGRLVSSLPISGGYGDELTFTSKITDKGLIEIDFHDYKSGEERNYKTNYIIDNNGDLNLIATNK
jgi:hypothetical protein